MKSIPLTPQERQVIEEAYAPYLQAVIIIAKLKGLSLMNAQLSGDRQSFLVADEPAAIPAATPALPEPDSSSNGVKTTFG